MSFKEIKELRQSGKLEEALQMAIQGLEADPHNIWNKRAAAWVYYDYLKVNAHPDSYEVFTCNLKRIKDLQLPEDEKMIFDNCAWQIGSLVFSLHKVGQVDFGKINDLFEVIKNFHFSKPSEAYSFIYKAFHKGYHYWSNYLTFADWWNFDNLRSEDYLNEEFNGKKIMSIAEQAYIAYAGKLLEGEAIGPVGKDRLINNEKIQSFMPKLDTLIESHPEYQYPLYFKAKLLLAMGGDENVLSAFLPFAKQRRNDFWVWELMAEIYSDDKDIQFSCYCKALSLKTPEDFLVKLRQNFVELLIERNMYEEATTEIQIIIDTRQKNAWKMPSQLKLWSEQEWFKSGDRHKQNLELYANNIGKAEEILFQDIPEELIAVEFVNESKGMLSFVKNKHKFGFFNYKGNLKKPKIGDLLMVRFNGDGQDNFYKILTLKKVDPELPSEAIRSIEGVLRVINPQGFGFIDGVFVEPNIIKVSKMADGQQVKGRAILSFNKKKNEWGWKAIEIVAYN